MGFNLYGGPETNIPAQPSCGNDREISFFVDFWTKPLNGTYRKDPTYDLTRYIYTFNPTFRLRITIDGTDYYAVRTIYGKSYTEYKAYSLKGPDADDEVIKTAPKGYSLGNNWIKL